MRLDEVVGTDIETNARVDVLAAAIQILEGPLRAPRVEADLFRSVKCTTNKGAKWFRRDCGTTCQKCEYMLHNQSTKDWNTKTYGEPEG